MQRNVAELARPLPLEDVRAGTTLSAEQVRMPLSVAEHHRDGPLWVLALATGARQSELVGLRRSDVDLERGSLTIARSIASGDCRPRSGWRPEELARRAW